jgi:hypothetical protein
MADDLKKDYDLNPIFDDTSYEPEEPEFDEPAVFSLSDLVSEKDPEKLLDADPDELSPHERFLRLCYENDVKPEEVPAEIVLLLETGEISIDLFEFLAEKKFQNYDLYLRLAPFYDPYEIRELEEQGVDLRKELEELESSVEVTDEEPPSFLKPYPYCCY